jgi:hypothetical protein
VIDDSFAANGEHSESPPVTAHLPSTSSASRDELLHAIIAASRRTDRGAGIQLDASGCPSSL